MAGCSKWHWIMKRIMRVVVLGDVGAEDKVEAVFINWRGTNYAPSNTSLWQLSIGEGVFFWLNISIHKLSNARLECICIVMVYIGTTATNRVSHLSD